MLKKVTHRCEVWFEFNHSAQVWQCRFGLPHREEHCSPPVVCQVVVGISIWQKVWRHDEMKLSMHFLMYKWINPVASLLTHPQRRGNERGHQPAGQQQEVSFPSPYGCPHSHLCHISLLKYTKTVLRLCLEQYIQLFRLFEDFFFPF